MFELFAGKDDIHNPFDPDLEPGSCYRSVALNIFSFLLFESVAFSFVGCLSDEGANSGAET